jgi:plasmid stabilization system protein ParE
MRGKTGLALGLAIGYVFGTKAGRERYEQLSQSAKRLADDPSLRRLQGELGGLFNASKQRATATIEGTATRAADKVEEANKSLADDQKSGSSPASTTSTGSRSSGSGASRSRSSSSRSRPSSGDSDA